MLDWLFEILLGIIGLSVVVVVHEAGHFAAARLTGIRVETFSVGFGKRLAGFQRNGTDFRLSLVPLGGYCRFHGEDSFRTALEQGMDSIPSEQGDFYDAPPWKRILVALAGPSANILFTILVFTMISWIGFREVYTEPRIILASEWSDERASWPADEAGLQSGDLITVVNGVVVDRFGDLRRELVFQPGEELMLDVVRGGRNIGLTITPELNKETGVAIIGVLNWLDPVIGSIDESSAASKAGLSPGDRIVTVNGMKTDHTVAYFNALSEIESETVVFVIDRQGSNNHIELSYNAEGDYGFSFRAIESRSEKLGPFRSIGRGTAQAFETLSTTLKGLKMLFMGIEVRNAVSGPLRLISDTGAVVAEGFRAGIGPGLLWSFELMSLISVSLAILNLLPIPVLDGGQTVLFLTEWARRRPIKPKSVYRYQFVGTIIVLIIAVAATTGDLMHFSGR